MWKDGKREENELWVKEDKMHDGKYRKKRGDKVEENLKAKTVENIETYWYLGITINEEGNLEGHIKVMPKKCETVSR